MPLRVTGLDQLAHKLEEASSAIKALDGQLTEVTFDPQDPSSVERAIFEVEAAIDAKVGSYRGNSIVDAWVAEIKEKYRQELLDRAAGARLNDQGEGMDSEPSIFRRLNNAASDLSAASFQTYGQAISKLARLLHSPEIEAITERMTRGVDLDTWLKGCEETKGSWVGSAKLRWPEEHEKELGTKILIIDRMAGDDRYATNFSYQFYYTGSNITSNLSSMTRQFMIPFVRDYVDYIRREIPPPKEKPDIQNPIAMRAHPIHMLVGWSTTILGLTLIGAGIYALVLGATSSTEISIMGNTFKSESVGAMAIFLGAVAIILNYRRLLTSVERLFRSSS
jgi:hypothetical protein